MRIVAAIVIGLSVASIAPFAAGGQESQASTQAPAAAPASQPAEPAAANPGALPAGFGTLSGSNENPVRRYEIVALGSFPIMLFYTGIGFDLGTYVAKGFDPLYAPWPFKNQYAPSLTDSERFLRLGVALGLSLIIGGIDAVIHAGKYPASAHVAAADTNPSPGPAPAPPGEIQAASPVPDPDSQPSLSPQLDSGGGGQ